MKTRITIPEVEKNIQVKENRILINDKISRLQLATLIEELKKIYRRITK